MQEWKGAPWVILASPAAPGYSASQASLPGDVASVAVEVLTFVGSERRVPFETLAARRRGHGIAAAVLGKGKSRTNPAYSAVRAAASAATALSALVDRQYRRFRELTGLAEVELIVPVVVFGGRLFELSLNDDGTDRFREIAAGEVTISSGFGADLSNVHVVTPIALPGFLQRAQKDAFRVGEALTAADGKLLADVRRELDRRLERRSKLLPEL